ncbi:hypothetical protein ACQPYH_06410 [Kribbella sp. CA-245084]|uniref:hypothetical protein n=1 Tax=Kribbella sp. CA-245084 TaxID=3239940 RepID=UPI003D8EE90D
MFRRPELADQPPDVQKKQQQPSREGCDRRPTYERTIWHRAQAHHHHWEEDPDDGEDHEDENAHTDTFGTSKSAYLGLHEVAFMHECIDISPKPQFALDPRILPLNSDLWRDRPKPPRSERNGADAERTKLPTLAQDLANPLVDRDVFLFYVRGVPAQMIDASAGKLGSMKGRRSPLKGGPDPLR